MSEAYGELLGTPERRIAGGLPTASGLDRTSRALLTFAAIDHALDRIGLSYRADSDRVRVAWPSKAGQSSDDYEAALRSLNEKILTELAVNSPPLGAAYQLGQSLQETCSLPEGSIAGHDQSKQILGRFSAHRVAALQSWLAQASDELPKLAASVVGRSVQNWQIWVDANSGTLSRRWTGSADAVLTSLHAQGGFWRALLSGQQTTVSEPGIEAWLEAAETAIHNAQRLGWQILRRFSPLVFAVLAAVGGLLYLSIDKSHGTSTVWTSMVTIAAGFGVTGASIKSAGQKAASTVEKSIAGAAEIDARAWAVTQLPVLALGPVRRARLRHAGVARPITGRRLERIGVGTVTRQALE